MRVLLRRALLLFLLAGTAGADVAVADAIAAQIDASSSCQAQAVTAVSDPGQPGRLVLRWPGKDDDVCADGWLMRDRDRSCGLWLVTAAGDVKCRETMEIAHGTAGTSAAGCSAGPAARGTSYQCVVPPVERGTLLTASGTPGSCSGALVEDLSGLWCASCPRPGHNPGPGVFVFAQLWCADPLDTSNRPSSLSNAIHFRVDP